MFDSNCKVTGGHHNITWVYGPMRDVPPLGKGKGIIIEDDVWLSAGPIVLDRADVGEGALIGAGAGIRGGCRRIRYALANSAFVVRCRFDRNSLSTVLDFVGRK